MTCYEPQVNTHTNIKYTLTFQGETFTSDVVVPY